MEVNSTATIEDVINIVSWFSNNVETKFDKQYELTVTTIIFINNKRCVLLLNNGMISFKR